MVIGHPGAIAAKKTRKELTSASLTSPAWPIVVKGGRHFAFRTIVVVGDNKGNVGIGIGKSRGVPESIAKLDHAAA